MISEKNKSVDINDTVDSAYQSYSLSIINQWC